MQIISTRPGTSFRVPADYFLNKPQFPPTHSPDDSSPLLVVMDGTDVPAPAREGHEWVVDTREDSQTYRRCVEIAKTEATLPSSPRLWLSGKLFLSADRREDIANPGTVSPDAQAIVDALKGVEDAINSVGEYAADLNKNLVGFEEVFNAINHAVLEITRDGRA